MTFEDFKNEWNNSQDFVVVTTSGSTGVPKILELPKWFMMESAKRTNTFFQINRNSRLHSCVSADYIGGKMMFVRADLAQAILTSEMPSNQPLKQFSSKEIIDLLAVVPSQMLYIIDNLESLPVIRNIIIGGSAIHPSLKAKIVKSGLNAYETYGMTETASHIALRKLSDVEIPFTVLPGIQISVDSNSCLTIKFNNGFQVQSNDIVELISDSEFIIKGRRDDVIISGGKKINPYELEEKIAPYVPSDFFLIGMPDEKWGQKLVLVIEGNPKVIDEKQLSENLRKILEAWQIPKSIIFKSLLPRTPNGKIIRRY